MSKTLSFSIMGDFVTKYAREQLFENHNFKKAMDWLLGCIKCEALSEAEIEHMALNILNGKGRMVGVYPDGDYHYEDIPGHENNTDIADAIEKWHKTSKSNQTQLEDLQKKLLFIYDYLSEECYFRITELQQQYSDEFDEILFPGVTLSSKSASSDFGGGLLDSFMKRMHNDTEDDYGWLEPNGTFHPVEWSEHENWAETYVQEHMSNDDWFQAAAPPSDKLTEITHAFGDYLARQGWILLHNPAQGLPQMTIHPTARITKAQKEFLYDFFIKRNMHTEANALYEE